MSAGLDASVDFHMRLLEITGGTELKSRMEAGAERQSWWRALGITVVALLCTVLVLFGGILGITLLFPS